MRNRLVGGWAVALVLALSANLAHATPIDNGDVGASIARARDEPIDTLIQTVEHAHPVAMLLLAKRLYDLDRRDEAVFWFYLGQLRWRACLAQNPNCERARFSRLFETIGPDLNRHAFRDLPRYYEMIDSVLAWDESHHDDYVTDAAAKESARQGMREMIEYTRANEDRLIARNDQLSREAAAHGDDPFAGHGGAIMGTPQELLTVYDAARFRALRRRVTTRDEAISALGRPEWWATDENGVTTFGYSYLRATDVASILGMMQRVQVTLEFNASRVLTEVRLPRN